MKGKQKWIVVVGRGKNWTPSSSQKVCEVSSNVQVHFTPSEIEFVAECKQVKFGSVPSRILHIINCI
ncbi:hypothetical protein DMN91_010314 [Ooceraea biroi]|uniref:Uncharacterized protein n=1 Tax=Ooceraea biroi TaxID=2015173 RepID=A0A3L8DCL2_OOCBI|nr:hypothetical protein DMN91_010314 [Ooceraea biroi]